MAAASLYGAAYDAVANDFGGVDVVHDGDGVLAHDGQSADHVLTALVVEHVGKDRTLAEAVHDAHRAHGHAVQEVGGVLQGGNAASGGVAVHDGPAGHGAHVERCGGIARAELGGDDGADFAAQEALKLAHAEDIEALVRLLEAGILLYFLFGEGADSAAGIGGADYVVAVHLGKVCKHELFAQREGLVYLCKPFLKTAAAAGAEYGAAVDYIQQIFTCEFSSYYSPLYLASSSGGELMYPVAADDVAVAQIGGVGEALPSTLSQA